ncbi:MAG: lysophospholipase, partial [Oligoflexia bacterium]|nr:lysophospholipase [Oligoflexia bacterium]
TWGIIGISLGGMVAMDWCREHPSDFSRLILINASAGNLSFPFERIRPLMVTRGIPSLFSADPLARETRILRMTTRLKQAEIATLALDWAKLAQARPIRTRTVISQLLAAALFRAPRAFTIPVLIASSAADRFTSPRCSQSLAHRFGASLVTHPQAGHDLPLDDPDWLSQQVRQWCDLSPAAHHNQTDS